MSCLGLLVALTAEQRAQLEALPDGEDRYFYVDSLMETSGEESYQELDKSWDALHRCLAKGTPGSKKLDTEWGAYPLNLAIIGGKWLSDDPGFIITMVEPEQLGDLAAALIGISEEQFTDLYRTHCKDAWPEYGEEDLEYNREYFHAMREFYARVAPTGRSVVFSADQ
jgi:hypothetical protein